MSRSISTLLVANRGEIAVRIMRTCREMGIRTVAVYSTVDSDALHARSADEAYCVGPPPALESYLRVDAILEAAAKSGADAIHPGYGFLAENAEFARAVVDAGMLWIGPPAHVIALLGDKVEAKRIASDAGVPTVPGYAGDDQSAERMTHEAARIGYPVMLKAAAGGGGKGMRAVASPEGLPYALDAARREARSAFADDRVFLEKLLANPRHIEIQVLVDEAGYGVSLGERECSIQRRHQKVLEESPSPVLTRDLRAQMGDAAVRLATAAGYRNAGTVEFLFAGDRFYFLEVNTRIQVEHPVTEMVTGLDIVRLQLDIASGQPLSIGPDRVQPRGHAVEARLYAEDSTHGFLPATGRIEVYEPPLGPGIRNDVGVGAGADVTQYYDPILAKIIVHAGTRAAALDRLAGALERYAVLGVTTNLPFLIWVVQQPAFRAGRMDTGFVDRTWEPPPERSLPAEVVMLAAAFEAVEGAQSQLGRSGPFNPWLLNGGWRVGGAARVYRYRFGDADVQVRVARDEAVGFSIEFDDVEKRVRAQTSPSGTIVIHDGPAVHTGHCLRTARGVAVSWRGQAFELLHPQLPAGQTSGAGAAGRDSATSPMPGTVVKVAVRPGQTVKAREPLLVLEAMKMEHVIEAPHDGVVAEVLYREGDLVPAGAPLVRLEEP